MVKPPVYNRSDIDSRVNVNYTLQELTEEELTRYFFFKQGFSEEQKSLIEQWLSNQIKNYALRGDNYIFFTTAEDYKKFLTSQFFVNTFAEELDGSGIIFDESSINVDAYIYDSTYTICADAV